MAPTSEHVGTLQRENNEQLQSLLISKKKKKARVARFVLLSRQIKGSHGNNITNLLLSPCRWPQGVTKTASESTSTGKHARGYQSQERCVLEMSWKCPGIQANETLCPLLMGSGGRRHLLRSANECVSCLICMCVCV